MPNFIALGQDVREKALQFFKHFSILTPQEDSLGPWGQSLPIVAIMYSRTPVWTCQISSPSENPSTRYLLPNFVDFVDNVIDKNSKRHCLWMQRIQRHPHILPRIKHETVAVGEGVPTISKVFCRICENLIGRSGHDWINDVREQSNVVCEIHNKSASSSHITKHPTTQCTANLRQSVAIAVRALGTHCTGWPKTRGHYVSPITTSKPLNQFAWLLADINSVLFRTHVFTYLNTY